jgi:hypothetical protein
MWLSADAYDPSSDAAIFPKGNIAKKHGVAEPGASVVIIGGSFGLEKLGLMPSQSALREVLPEGRTARSI